CRVTRDFHVTPGHRAGPARAEGLERRLPRREPRRQVDPRAILTTAVRELGLAECLPKKVVASVESRPERRDVDEIDAHLHGSLEPERRQSRDAEEGRADRLD